MSDNSRVLALLPRKLLKIRYHAFRKAFRHCWMVKKFLRILRLGGMYMKDGLFEYIFSLHGDSRMYRFMHRVLTLWFSLFKVECKICCNKTSDLCVNKSCGHCICLDCRKKIFLHSKQMQCPFCRTTCEDWLFLPTAILRKRGPIFYR